MTAPSTAPSPTLGAPRSNADKGAVRLVRSLSAGVPADAAITLVQRIDSLPQWERKVRTVRVVPHGQRRGRYAAEGRLFGLVPWRATFEYEMTDSGFRSAMLDPRRRAVCGGFRVTARGPSSCTVVHYERYESPVLRHAWVRSIWTRYVSRTMAAELTRLVTVLESATMAAAASPHDGEAYAADMAGETAERTRAIHAAPEVVWAVIGDVTRMPEWSEELESVQIVAGDGRSAGSCFRGNNAAGTRSWSMTCVIDVYDDGRALEFHTQNDKGEPRTRWWYRLEPADEGTLVTEGFMRLAKVGRLRSLAEKRLLGDRTEHNIRNIDESLGRLAHLVESNA